MPRVTFGNTHVIEKVEHPEHGTVTRHLDHIEATESVIDLLPHWVPAETPADLDSWSRDESFRSITHPGGWWSSHSDAKPAWVECPDWPELEAILRLWYGVEGRPAGWENVIGDAPQIRVDLPDVPTVKEGD